MRITFDKFVKIMQHIIAAHDFQNEIEQAANRFNDITRDMCVIYTPSVLEEDLVHLLEDILGDSNGLISYWVYELECGDLWEPGCVEDEDGNDIPLASIESLWKLLTEDRE